jgi:hypothetical protein
MKKGLLIYIASSLIFILLATLLRGWFELKYYPFWIGGLIGTFLPSVDFFIVSRFVKNDFQNKEDIKPLVLKALGTQSVDRRSQSPDLIFHTAFFQTLFFVATFLMITSSGSLLGMGLTLTFSLRLYIDQITDFLETKTISNWFVKMNVNLSSRQEKLYLGVCGFLILLLGFVF